MPGPVVLANSNNAEYNLANGGQPIAVATLLAGEKLPNNAGDGYLDVGTNGIWYLLDVATAINVAAGIPNSGGAAGVIGDSRLLGVRWKASATAAPTLTITGCMANASTGAAVSMVITPNAAISTTNDNVADQNWGQSICNNFAAMTLTASNASVIEVCLRASGQVSP